MARNHEKQYGRLNRLILFKEKDEFQKANPTRPKLDLLNTPEEIQKWIPSIKRDIDFYLKKSKVICYSDQQIEECKLKIIQLEKEFKAFIRKIKKLTPGALDVIPWTSRPYKRKKLDSVEREPPKEFAPIVTPLLSQIKKDGKDVRIFDSPSMNEPLIFTPADRPSKEFYFSERANVNLTEVGSTSKTLSEHNIVENISFKNINSPENNILCRKYDESFSIGFQNNSLLNEKNNASPCLAYERSFSCGPIDNENSSVNTMEDILCEKKENCTKLLCVHTPSNPDISADVDSLCKQECAILRGARSNTPFQFHINTEKKFETENKNNAIRLSNPVKLTEQFSMKLVDYNCSDSDNSCE